MSANAYNVQAPGDKITSVLKYNALTAAVGRITDISLSPVQPFDYVVFKVGATYYRRNCATGIVDDDNAAFHTLMNDLLAASICVGIVPDTYTATAAITAMDDRSTVIGWPGTQISPTGNINIFEIDGSNADTIVNARISGINFLGQSDASTARAVWTDFADDLLLDNLVIRGFDGANTAAILLRDSNRVRVLGNTFQNGTRGLELLQNDDVNRAAGSENCTIVGNNFEGLTENAIRLDESDSSEITGDSFKTCGATGEPVIEAITSVLSAKISVNIESSDGGGVYGPFGESNIHLTSEAIGAGNNEPAIHVSGSGNVISGTITRAYGHAVHIAGSSNLVDNMLIYSPGWSDGGALHDGIFIDAGKDYVKIGESVKIYSTAGKFMRYGVNISAATCNDTQIGNIGVFADGATVTLFINDAGTTTRFPVTPANWFSHLDLSGGATDHEVYTAVVPSFLAGYRILYTEASSANAGVNIRVGRYQDGVALDDDYFDVTVSEVSENLGYHLDVLTASLTQETIAAGDTVTVGTAGGKTGTGEVVVMLKIVETG